MYIWSEFGNIDFHFCTPLGAVCNGAKAELLELGLNWMIRIDGSDLKDKLDETEVIDGSKWVNWIDLMEKIKMI